MRPGPTERLANFAALSTYDDLPKSSREHARNLLADSVACALAADFSDESELYRRYATAVGGEGGSTVIGSDETLSILGATLLNGYLITAATVNDVYVPGHVHITPEVVPAALSIAEQEKCDGRALLEAIAIGSEIAVRISDALKYSVAAAKLGWHFPGVVGPFGAAAAVGRLRGLSANEMRDAFGIAASQASGTYASMRTPAVKFHQSRGAVSGLLAGILAGEGFGAASEVLIAPHGGLLNTYSDGGDPQAAISELGQRYVFEQISLRLWPGGTPVQPALTSLFALLSVNKPDFRNVDRLRIFLAPSVVKTHGPLVQPTGTFDALISHRFVLASALKEGRFWLDMVTSETVDDPEFRRFLRENVELVPDSNLTRESSYVEIAMNDGTVLRSDESVAKGSPSIPATLADLREKYEKCSEGRLDERDAAELWDLLVGLENVADLTRMFAIMRSACDRKRSRL